MPLLSEINEKPPEYMQAVRNFVFNPRGFLLIAGTNGNGKSFTAEAIFEHHQEPHPWEQKLFWNQAKLKTYWTEQYAKFGEVSYLIERLVVASLLVLDDIGVGKPTDAFLDFLYLIVDERYKNREKQGTIITTNLSSETMPVIMGGAFTSRVASGIRIRHDGPDRRPEKF